MVENEFASHSMFRGCLLILFAYIWLKAFKNKIFFSILVKNLLSKSGDFFFLLSKC